MTADSIAQALHGRRSGSSWMAKCPAHRDHNPSLSISEVSGKVLLHCHAGCAQSDVIEQLRVRRLWPNGEHQATSGDIEAVYEYTSADGQLLYQILRHWSGVVD